MRGTLAWCGHGTQLVARAAGAAGAGARGTGVGGDNSLGQEVGHGRTFFDFRTGCRRRPHKCSRCLAYGPVHWIARDPLQPCTFKGGPDGAFAGPGGDAGDSDCLGSLGALGVLDRDDFTRLNCARRVQVRHYTNCSLVIKHLLAPYLQAQCTELSADGFKGFPKVFGGDQIDGLRR